MLPVLALAALSLTACSGMMNSEQAAKQVYMLMPSNDSSTAAPQQGPELSLSLGAVPGLDTDWIQALSSDARLTRYANARWPDHLPEVLASVIQRSLAASGRFSAVEQSTRSDPDAWRLQLEVQKFYGLRNAQDETTRVVTEFSGSIDCSGQSHSFMLNESVPVSGERLSAVVAAHQQGLNAATDQLVRRIFEACE